MPMFEWRLMGGILSPSLLARFILYDDVYTPNLFGVYTLPECAKET